MELSQREKQLLWRGLCISEELERDRISYYTTNEDKKFNEKARTKIINTSKKRLKEIEKLKEKWWSEFV